ncbi:hypothetical protein BDQ17DRAFT_1249585, partial [Cyathus striatus]
LAEMPMDIWFEIFVLLEPLDLVHLSRTSKSLRTFLLGVSASSVWMCARSNMDGLPKCPKDMNELDYATLIFETHCQRCLSVSSHMCWDLRIRLCLHCLKSDTKYVLFQFNVYKFLY